MFRKAKMVVLAAATKRIDSIEMNTKTSIREKLFEIFFVIMGK